MPGTLRGGCRDSRRAEELYNRCERTGILSWMQPCQVLQKLDEAAKFSLTDRCTKPLSRQALLSYGVSEGPRHAVRVKRRHHPAKAACRHAAARQGP